MAPSNNEIVYVYYNGKIDTNNFGVYFQSDHTKAFKLSSKSTFAHLKQRIEEKINLPISNIIYRHPLIFGENGGTQFAPLYITDDDDVQLMFHAHGNFAALGSIELYVAIAEYNHPSNIIQPSTSIQCYDAQQTQYEPSSSSQPPLPYSQQHTQQHESSIPQHDSNNHQVEPYRFLLNSDANIRQEYVGDDSDDEEDVHDDVPFDEEETPSNEPYIPPNHMRNINFETLDQVDDRHRALITTNATIDEGSMFHNKEDCVLAIKQYHINHTLDYIVTKSDTTRYVIKCVNNECSFKLRAAFWKRNDMWKISTVDGQHTCTSTALSQDHRKLDSTLISQSTKSLVSNDPSIKVKSIIAHIREKFNYTTSYRKAWIAKNKAIEDVYGNWEQSYNELPQWLMAMKQYLPETVIILDTLPYKINGQEVETHRTFHRLFWAFHPCIVGFNFCKPIVQVDGTWLYGKYKGTLLMAVAQDGENHIFPIAFALVEGETKDAWSFFLKNLRRHVTPQSGICLISDRHESIKSAYSDPQNGWHDTPTTHVYCIRHIAQNFMRAIKDGELRKQVTNMGNVFLLI